MKFTREDYIAALALLDEVRAMLGPNGEHWIKGQYYGISHQYTYGKKDRFLTIGSIPPNCWCMHGAIRVRGPLPDASLRLSTPGEAILGLALRDTAHFGSGNAWQTIHVYNDDRDTTWVDMQRWMDDAEARLRIKMADLA